MTAAAFPPIGLLIRQSPKAKYRRYDARRFFQIRAACSPPRASSVQGIGELSPRRTPGRPQYCPGPTRTVRSNPCGATRDARPRAWTTHTHSRCSAAPKTPSPCHDVPRDPGLASLAATLDPVLDRRDASTPLQTELNALPAGSHPRFSCTEPMTETWPGRRLSTVPVGGSDCPLQVSQCRSRRPRSPASGRGSLRTSH